MLGWYIVVFVADSESSDNKQSLTEKTRLASWNSGIGGRNWLDQLVTENKLLDLGGNGYPYTYSGKALVVLPIIASGPPSHDGPDIIGDDYFISGNKVYSLKLNELGISQCNPEAWLIIEVWDQS
jgi:hypothetical protein